MKIKKILAIILSIVIMVIVLPINSFTANAATWSSSGYADNTTALNEVRTLMQQQTTTYNLSRFNYILEEYPLSGYFNSKKTSPCEYHYSCGCGSTAHSTCMLFSTTNKFYDKEKGEYVYLGNVGQCIAYGNYCLYRFFGKRITSGISVSSLNKSTGSNFKNYLDSFNDLTGTQFYVGYHSFTYLAKDSTYIYFIDANSGGSLCSCGNGAITNCKINLRRFTYDNFVSKYGSITLYTEAKIVGNHTYPSDWTTVTAPTCMTNGTAQRICSTCGNTETKTLPATGHGFYSGYEAVHPHKYYQKCNCGYYYYTGEHQFLDTCNSCIDTTLVKLEKYNNHTYEIYDINISWERAKEFCEQKGGHLVTITTQEELDFLNELTLYQDTWLGGYLDADSSWNWVTGEEFEFTSWNIGEPNNSWGIEKYIGTHNDGGWNDFSVSDTHIIYFACEYEPILINGDIDNNGEINSLDLTNLRITLLSNDINYADNITCDANGDGKVNIIDLIRLKKYLAGFDVLLGAQNTVA